MSLLKEIQNSKTLLIIQQTDCIQIIPCCQKTNKYKLHHTNYDFKEIGQQIGQIQEVQPNCFCKYFCKWYREFNVQLKDIKGESVSLAHKSFIPPCANCMHCLACLSFCKNSIEIKRNGTDIGIVEQPCWCALCPIAPKMRGFCSDLQLNIKDQTGNIKYTITAPCLVPSFICCLCGCCQTCSRKQYKILDTSKSQVGKIQNIYNGIFTQLCTRADKFGIHFPINSTADDKLRIIQAVILMDFIQYRG